MGVAYILVNQTRREAVMYLHLGAWKAAELAGNPAAAAVTTWYMLQCRGDRIAFVSDTNGGVAGVILTPAPTPARPGSTRPQPPQITSIRQR